MNYPQRIAKVIAYIGKHLDEELSLDDLCRVACFSKYHFHRLFTAQTGMSLHAYIKWLRLKRAAHQLTLHKELTIITIALRAGFKTHESFARAFKQACGKNPNEFRHQPCWDTWENPVHAAQHQGKKIMPITIKELPAKRLAVMEHHGDPLQLSHTLEPLISWAKSQPINLKPKPGEWQTTITN